MIISCTLYEALYEVNVNEPRVSCEHNGKIWNQSGNVYRNYMTFIADMQLIKKQIYGVVVVDMLINANNGLIKYLG